MKHPGWPGVGSALLALVLGACVASQGLKVDRLQLAEGGRVLTPVKAHLKDGSTVVFTGGVKMVGGRIMGKGVRYDLALKPSGEVETLELADVMAIESFRTDVNGPATAVLSILGTAAGVVAASALAVAIFGSCPTVYGDMGPGRPPATRVEAETFSYSIVPLFESRDLDRLAAVVGDDGRLRLEVRNEALETHYINHLQVLEVRHGDGQEVLPDQHGRPLVVGARIPPAAAAARGGADVAARLRRADGHVFQTDARTLAAAGPGDLQDWIDLTFPRPRDGAPQALVLRARSSLLNTVLFYDVMLGAAGPRALDWLGRDLDRISDAVELGRFCQKYMGLKVAVRTSDGFREVARVPDPGPIAWHDVAVALPPLPGEGDVQLRLGFVADAWRIDAAALAAVAQGEEPRALAVAEVTGPTRQAEPAALRSLREPDHDYLQTSPGQRFFVRFDPEPLPAGRQRTFLLSSQGYYTEWIRAEWLRDPPSSRPFAATEASIVEALARWRHQKPSLEARFEKRRVPMAE